MKGQKEPLPLAIPKVSPLKDGDIFTIQGLQVTGPGRYKFNCKPGMETEFIARTKTNSVFRLTNKDD